MFLMLHATKYNYLGHLIHEGFKQLVDDLMVLTEESGDVIIPEDVTVVVLSSLNPQLYSYYKSLKIPEHVKKVAVDSLDLNRLKPDYAEFDLIFLREYTRNQPDYVIPLCMGLTRERIERIRQYSRPWGERKIGVFFRSSILTPPRKEIVRFFNSKSVLEAYGLDQYKVDVKEGTLREDEFYKALGNAKCCLSPEGGGWDCFRHYEIMAASAFPILPYHWYWNPDGYRSTFSAIDQCKSALKGLAPWHKIGIRLEDEIDKGQLILREIEKRFDITIPPAITTPSRKP